MVEQTKNDNIHDPRSLIKASFNSLWFNEALSDIAGTFTSNLAMFALKRYNANKLDLDYASHQRAYTNIAGIWFLKTLVTTVSYNVGASLYSCISGAGSKAFNDITNVKNNLGLFGIFGGLEIAEVKAIDPSQSNFLSKAYFKARIAVSSLKASGSIISDALTDLDYKKLFNFYYAIPRAVAGNFFADMTTRFAGVFGLNNIGVHIGEFNFDVTEAINSLSREFAHMRFDIATEVNSSNVTIDELKPIRDNLITFKYNVAPTIVVHNKDSNITSCETIKIIGKKFN